MVPHAQKIFPYSNGIQMAGTSGKSGGARSGAGRKPKPKPELAPIPASLANMVDGKPFDPRPALEQVALGLLEVTPQQYKALTALLPYVHQKLGEGGKKEQKQEAAKKVAGRFAAAAPPKLATAGGMKV
jgi:phage terminase small subunit